ncbi:MAG: dihydroneopterin aldolase [Candidatus Peribacteraceae bacterium]|nr:dihydroneopterin aldolase [Candidatus Peribacteraceae bacterium]MDD5075313.1 dihydroneopterin aldolase [Candidatus Peribacteraceae bacterium]
MPDLLTIENLELRTRIGLPEEERAKEQRVLVTVELSLATTQHHHDDLEQSIDYASVVESVLELAKTERRTMEFFAEEIAALILKKFRAKSVCVTVKKFALPGIDHASFTVTRP